MNIINIVDSVALINFGIWNTVISIGPYLKDRGAKVELWYQSKGEVPAGIRNFAGQKLIGGLPDFKAQLSNYDSADTIVVTHGLWKFPSRWGRVAQKLGFKWVIIPHGMLEPWSMNQKWFKKVPYYQLIEKQKINNSNAIIAVGLPEKNHLESLFGNKVSLISNGISPVVGGEAHKSSYPYTFLFLSRLHKKKGVLPLVKGWGSSSAFKKGAQLIIAGPDDGELSAINAQIGKYGKTAAACNMIITGAVYGSEKEALFRKANFFVLPSHSEGFPTVVLEAMTYGCIPIITEGCNFPEAFAEKVAIQIEPTPYSISVELDKIYAMKSDQILELSKTVKQFVDRNYSLEKLSQSHYDLYKRLLAN